MNPQYKLAEQYGCVEAQNDGRTIPYDHYDSPLSDEQITELLERRCEPLPWTRTDEETNQ